MPTLFILHFSQSLVFSAFIPNAAWFWLKFTKCWHAVLYLAALLPTVHHGAGITYVELLFTILGFFFRRATMKFNIFVLRLRIMVTHGEYSLTFIYSVLIHKHAVLATYCTLPFLIVSLLRPVGELRKIWLHWKKMSARLLFPNEEWNAEWYPFLIITRWDRQVTN